MRATMTPIRRVTTKAKGILSGDGNAQLKTLERDVDEILDNLEELDRACWALVRESKDRLYAFLEAFAGNGSGRKQVNHVTTAWNKLVESSKSIASDVRPTVRAIRGKASDN